MYSPKPFPRPHPKDKSKGTWVCKVKVGSHLHSVSLGVPWPGNKRESSARAVQLQVEIQAGKLRPETLAWLGGRAAEKLALLMGTQAALGGEATAPPETWEAARQAWLASTDVRDTKPRPSGKVNVIDRMKKDRRSRSAVFVAWCVEKGEKFRGRTFTSTLRAYLAARSEAGKEPATVNHDYRVLVKFGEFLAERGFTESPDRKSIKEILPNEESAENWVPDPETDLDILTRLYERRFDSEDDLNAWRLVLIVRGLACRPTEAIHLAWTSIDLAGGTVTFKDRKNRKGKRRRDETIPIVLRWVADGLAELKALGARPNEPVCVSTRGVHWSSEAMSAKCLARARKRRKIPARYKLKAAQRAAIAHLEDLGFSPYLIAHLAGHSLKTQEEHYTRPGNYWRVGPGREFGRWDRLTPIGEKVRAKFTDPLPSILGGV